MLGASTEDSRLMDTLINSQTENKDGDASQAEPQPQLVYAVENQLGTNDRS